MIFQSDAANAALKKKCQSDLQTLWDQHSIEKAAK
jgi:hypothetical protein